MVLLPVGRRPKKNSVHHSIIEHEFVHVCQALCGRFPSNFENTQTPLLGQFTHFVQAEFEANYLQLSFCPDLAPTEFEMTTEEWCFLRGYTQALERFLLSGICGNFSEAKLFDTLKKLPPALQRFIKKMGMDSKLNTAFIGKLKTFTSTALTISVPVETLDPIQLIIYEKLLNWTRL